MAAEKKQEAAAPYLVDGYEYFECEPFHSALVEPALKPFGAALGVIFMLLFAAAYWLLQRRGARSGEVRG